MTVLDYTEYQEAAYSTCTPECYTDAYLTPGYLSEVGEVAGKIAKRVRGDAVQAEHVMEELGDVAWFIAAQARLHGEQIILNDKIESGFAMLGSFFRGGVEDLIMIYPRSLSFSMRFRVLKSVCETMGFDFDEILKMNNRKLASRQKRGVIKGDGDHR